MKFIRVLCIITKDMQHISRSCPGLCMKKLGRASAGAAGLKELVHVLQETMRACPF